MNLEVQCRLHKGSPIIPILNRIYPIPLIDTYLFKVHFNIVPHLRLGLPKGLFPVELTVKILKALLPSFILAIWFSHLNLHSDYIRWTVKIMKFLIMEHSLPPLFSLLGPNIRHIIFFFFSNTKVAYNKIRQYKIYLIMLISPSFLVKILYYTFLSLSPLYSHPQQSTLPVAVWPCFRITQRPEQIFEIPRSINCGIITMNLLIF